MHTGLWDRSIRSTGSIGSPDRFKSLQSLLDLEIPFSASMLKRCSTSLLASLHCSRYLCTLLEHFFKPFELPVSVSVGTTGALLGHYWASTWQLL